MFDDTMYAVISELPHAAEAVLCIHPDSINSTLEVKLSPLVHFNDPCRVRIADFLSKVCAKETDRETVRDKGWLWREYQRTEYTVFDVCPGDTVDHLCYSARIEPSADERLTK